MSADLVLGFGLLVDVAVAVALVVVVCRWTPRKRPSDHAAAHDEGQGR